MLKLEDARGIIFDCDGTLLDSLGAWDMAEREIFAQAGPLTRKQEDEIHSAPIEEAAQLLHEQYGVGQSSEKLLAHLDDVLIPFYRDKVLAFEGVYRFLEHVSARSIPCVVLSSSPRRYLEAGLSRVALRTYFKELITTDEIGCSKRDFEIYKHAIRTLGATAESVWAIDDAPYAIEVMHRFGLNTICVGSHVSEYADVNVSSLDELL